ncbi:MAG: TDT family transporter [Methanomassiliicoccaceae archaeon]|jgi:exfoliative toxin A/B|nr:TDT family transporter [Methanomassiliicoccaceae archaeon]
MGTKEFIRKIPVPICGLSLGLASLDRFLWYVHNDIYVFNIFALLAFIILILFTLRMMIDRKGVAKDIASPAVFGVLPTYTMTVMLLSAYAADHAGGIVRDIALVPWLGAIAASYVMMLLFAKRFFFNFSIDRVFPSWIIVFVGYVVASLTSISFGMEQLGQVIFWSGFIGYMCMLPLTAYRILVHRNIPGPLIPTTAIFAAPANLCIVGYIASYGAPAGTADIVFIILVILGVVSYASVMLYLPVMLGRKFHPSFSSLTFPLVISAVSFYRLGDLYGLLSNDTFRIIQTGTLVIAVCMVVYVSLMYTAFLCRGVKKSVSGP